MPIGSVYKSVTQQLNVQHILGNFRDVLIRPRECSDPEIIRGSILRKSRTPVTMTRSRNENSKIHDA